jgi:hypothetical protein
MNQHLGMGLRAENVTAFLELMPELRVVEDLTSRGEHDLTIFVRQRLAITANVHHAQFDVSQPDFPAVIESVSVRSPVPDCGSHSPQ